MEKTGQSRRLGCAKTGKRGLALSETGTGFSIFLNE